MFKRYKVDRDYNKKSYMNFKRRVLQPAVKKLGLPQEVNLHTFRHISVFLGVLSGSDILAISKNVRVINLKAVGLQTDKP